MSCNNDNTKSRSALSVFFLYSAVCWGILWLVYVISGIPIVMLTKSVAFDPAGMSTAQSTLLELGHFMHNALRWVFPVSLPAVWVITALSSKSRSDADRKSLSKAGIASAVTCAVLLAVMLLTYTLLPIDQLRAGSGIVSNLLIRLYAMLTAAPVEAAALAYAMLARSCGKELGCQRLHSFGKSAVVANGAMLAVTLVAAFVTVIKGTWMSIDWIVILPLAASVIYECARSSKELTDGTTDGE